jgi:hypothetical protein
MVFVNGGYYPLEKYQVNEDAKKLIFFNPFETLRMELESLDNHYGGDLLLPGVSSMCLCNPQWREDILGHGVYMSMALGGRRNNPCLLQQVHVPNLPDGFYALKVNAVDEVYDPAYHSVIHRRTQNYQDTSMEDIWRDLDEQYKKVLEQKAYILRPRFYDWLRGGAHKPCVNVMPLETHW